MSNFRKNIYRSDSLVSRILTATNENHPSNLVPPSCTRNKQLETIFPRAQANRSSAEISNEMPLPFCERHSYDKQTSARIQPKHWSNLSSERSFRARDNHPWVDRLRAQPWTFFFFSSWQATLRMRNTCPPLAEICRGNDFPCWSAFRLAICLFIQ